ncbi:cytochrome c [Pararhizobium mangrovi]|uniref:C-type cytochrome n=1 Tax=Pararhizobium mangrovi TaxID=2590452 RepID=A0A506U2W1_9HYPH|nr:cytochrome c [Pararhizobium mangrovi]TPW27611.1 c-type cytochrome [Pararhizobium mangrovi]
MRKVLLAVLVVIVVVAVSGWVASGPRPLDASLVASAGKGDAKAGETMFWAGGCAGCHAGKNAKGDDLLKLGGGQKLDTAFGLFVTPNISPDPEHGIGKWSFAQFANAVKRGIGPDGKHLYPAFPYPDYERMRVKDVADLWAYMKTLPKVQTDPPGNSVPFPFNIRRGIGLWKRAFLHPKPVVALATDADAELKRGRYLVEGPGHCGACHTPRDSAGGSDYDQWLAGGPNPDGKGKIPNITPSKAGIGSWSKSDIVYFLESGFTPSYDTVGGSMVAVQNDIAHLPKSDREAIAAYLKAVPALPPKSDD